MMPTPPTPPAEDIELATERGLLFVVATKPGHRLAWVDQGEPVTLAEVCVAASLLDAFEVGIFIVRQGGHFVYWTSRPPDLYNTTVLSQVIR